MVEIADRRNELAGNLSLLAFESAWRRRDPEAVLGMLRRRRGAAVGAAVPRPGQAPREAADRPLRARAPDRRPAHRPDPQAGGPRPGHLGGAGPPGRPGRAGLRPRRELAQHAGMPVSVRVPAERFAPEVETCVWFTCAEAVANALKHSRASRLEIAVRRRGDALQVDVSDDGVGGADLERGSGLRRLAERIQHAGGELAIRSPADGGTRIVAELDLSESP